MYSTGQDRIVPVFDLGARELLYSLPTLNGYVYCLAANPIDPSVLAVGVGDGMIRIWKTGSTRSFDLHHLKLNQGKIMSLSWHPTREGLLGFGTDEGRVGWMDAFSQRYQSPTYSSYQHKGGVYSITWGPGIAGFFSFYLLSFHYRPSRLFNEQYS